MVSLPKLNEIEYLQLTDKDRIYVTENQKILIEGRRTTHRDQINNKRNVVTLQKGYIVMARREFMSEKAKDRVE